MIISKLKSNESKSRYFPYSDNPQVDTALHGNIENFIGYAQVPVGLAGPLDIHGDYASGSYQIPLATTEGALVASYSRGMKACRLAGGVQTLITHDSMVRAPHFKFDTMLSARQFSDWLADQIEPCKTLVGQTSNYCKLINIECEQEGNVVTVYFRYTTADASGQNMTTIATDAICHYVINAAPVSPTQWYIESNASGDKKATRKSMLQTRGKKVMAEVTIPSEVVNEVLKSTPKHICQYYMTSTLSSVKVGALGNTGHIANGLTALYIACGQDVACVAEAAVGLLRMEVNPAGDLYAALTLPSLVVGTIGGGTGLSTQRECLEMIDCYGKDKAQKFAEICAATALAGELSIAAAIAEDHFTQAHQSLGRKN